MANAYFPNSAHITFCRKVVQELTGFTSGFLILGGDFNIPLNPAVDSSSCITYRALKRIKTLLNSLQLIDAWRFLHPDARNFTFHSIPHDRYSRIDYLFITQRDLQAVTGTHIGIQSLSVQAPISLIADLCITTDRSNTWRQNASLLTDPSLLPKITTALSDFFKLNTTPDMDPMLIWEAHKCTLRGELMKMGSQRKKTQEQEINNLAVKIYRLETTHKQSMSVQSARELLYTRKALQQIFEAKTKRLLFFKKKVYYESGDKTGL